MNQMLKTALFLLSLCILTVGSVAAQTPRPTDDVCCYLYDKVDGKIVTSFAFMTLADCKKGKKTADGTVCSYTTDKDNCGATAEKVRCTQCGFNWLSDLGVCSEKTLEELAPKKDKNAKN